MSKVPPSAAKREYPVIFLFSEFSGKFPVRRSTLEFFITEHPRAFESINTLCRTDLSTFTVPVCSSIIKTDSTGARRILISRYAKD